MARSIPLGRMAQSDEIARAAVFLASENAGFVTGQSLHVNGARISREVRSAAEERARWLPGKGAYGRSPLQPAARNGPSRL